MAAVFTQWTVGIGIGVVVSAVLFAGMFWLFRKVGLDTPATRADQAKAREIQREYLAGHDPSRRKPD